MRRLMLAAVALFAAAGLLADTRVVNGERHTVTDLVYRIESVAGMVEDLRVRETPTEIHIDLSADVLFEFDRSDILPDAAAMLTRAGQLILDHGATSVTITGHTDGRGSMAYNDALSVRRAESVRDWFTQDERLGKLKFETAGRGAREPIAPNGKPDGSDDPEGRRKNRRVTITIRK